MRFLLEKDENITTLLQAKESVEESTGKKYSELPGDNRAEFIVEVINKLPNSKVFRNAHTSIVNSIKDSN